MVEYLRETVSKSKPGDKYGKLLQPLSLNPDDPLLSITKLWKIFDRKLCPPACRWFYIHWSCKFLHCVCFYHVPFFIFYIQGQAIMIHIFITIVWFQSNFNVQVDGSVVTKQGVRFVFTDGSRIIYRLSVSGICFTPPPPLKNLTSILEIYVQLNIKCLLCFLRERVLQVQLSEFTSNSLNLMPLNMILMLKLP